MQPSSVESSILHPATTIGAVQLTVTDLDRSIDFYRRVIGFHLHERSSGQANLGAGGPTLLQLVENPAARQVTHHSGLYHFAVLTPSRPALGRVLRRIVEAQVRLGGSDHSVSEALYFDDPDGNGIEVYRDRPRAEWAYADGKPVLGNAPLDYRGILGEADEREDGLDPATVIGHVHLHVGDLASAMNFYIQTIGFDLIMTWQGAAFYSAGGYHHHIATNTWAGVGAPPQPADAVGLRHYEIVLAGEDERSRLLTRLDTADVACESRADGLFVRDPAQNGVLFVVK
jgi:catechol 2,3-dioxygenase